MKNIQFPNRIRPITIFLFLAFLLPPFIKSSFLINFLIFLGVWIVLTDSLNFVTGFAGQLSLGHAAFVTIGAYAGGILTRDHNWPFWFALFAGGLASALTALILGGLALRLRGDYLGMVTLGFGEIVRIFSINWLSVTNGPAGFANIPRPSLFGYILTAGLPFYFLILFLLVLTHFGIERILLSRFGRASLAVRDDEIAASAMGVKTHSYKVWAFFISCCICGMVGVFYAAWITAVGPNSFNLNDSIMLNVMNTLGGIGSLDGAFPGGAIIGGLPELLRPFTSGFKVASLRFVFMGLLLIVLMILRPQGFYGMSIIRGYISLKPLVNVLRQRDKQQNRAPEKVSKFRSAVDDKILLDVFTERDLIKQSKEADNELMHASGDTNG